jgi:chaperonin GroES
MTKAHTIRLRPLDDRIIVEEPEPTDRTRSGILLPDRAKEKPQRSRVLRVGPGALDKDDDVRVPLEVKPGDEVLFRKYSGHELEIDGLRVRVLRADDVVGIVEGE